MALRALERDGQLAEIAAAFAEAQANRGNVVLISGEAGIGKTTLVRAFLADLDPSVRVLAGICDDLMAPRTLGALRDATLATNGPLRQALAAGSLDDVMTSAVVEFAGPAPTVLVIEDLHWADDATLDVLGHLARRIESSPTLVVLTFRDDELSGAHPLRRLLGILSAASPTRLRLEPLTIGAVRELANDDGRDAAALHSTTGGNPFYVVEALAAAPGDVSPTVAATVLARVHRLSAGCQKALEQLCVVPGTIEFELAEELLGRSIDLLGEAEERRIIEMRPTGIGFRHELTRRALEHSLPAIVRRSANRSIIRALLDTEPLDLARLVHHASGAGDDRTIVAYAPAAGREAAKVGSHRQALIHYEAALRTDLLGPTDRAVVLDEYAWELYNAHRVADAVDASRQAVELHRSNDDREAAGVTMVSLAHQLLLNGEPAQAFSTITEALAILEQIGSVSSRAYVTTYYGSMLGTAEVLAMAVPILERALELAIEAERPDLQAMCSIYLGLCREDLANDERIAMIRQGVLDAAANGDHEGAGRGYTILAELLNRFGYLNELEECIAEGSAYMVDHDLPVYSLRFDIMRCQHMIRRGQWDAAERELRAILETVDVGSMVGVIASAHLGKILARRGSADAAELVNSTFERAKAARINLPLAYAGLAHAEWSWLSGQPTASDATEPRWTVNSSHPVATPMYAEFLRHAQRGGQRVTVFAGCPEPWASALKGNWRAAADAWARIGDPYEQALELGDSGELGPMFQALSILEGLGADAAAVIVRKRLRDMGVQRLPRGPAATTRANPSGLTERQSEVLALIGHGLTNTEIAQRLVLSVRTVDHHVSAILMKLDVSTRREAVALARRRAAAAQPVR